MIRAPGAARDDPFGTGPGVHASRGARYADDGMKRSGSTTAATVETPPLDDAQRAARLAQLAERLLRPDGLDRNALERIEQLHGDE